LLVVSAASAIALQTDLGARARDLLIPLNVLTFLVAWALARWLPVAARTIVLGLAYAFPAVLLVTLHGFDDTLFSVWTSALLGLILGTTGLAGWALPMRWRWPLALWGLSVAASWPVVVWRELDFTPAQLDRYSTSVTHIGIPPAAECAWIAHMAATHLVGILWADALWRDQATGGTRLERAVAPPLLAGALASAVVGIYQMFGHIATLNPTVFAAFHRSAGLMLDGNAFGMVAALWVAGAIALTAYWSAGGAQVALLVAAVTLALGVWASGSQSALLALAVGSVGAAYGAWRDRPARQWGTRAVVLSALVAALALGGAAFAVQHSSAIGPLARLKEEVQADRSASKLGFLSTLWTRDRYGATSAALIREYPLTGVGVGLFNTLVIDESAIHDLGTPTPDNAQNWFRQQLVELGLIGSLGWILWLVVLVPTFWRQPPPGTVRAAYAIRGSLVGLGLASLVGVPTMNPVVLITFWTFVCWHSQLLGLERAVAATERLQTWPLVLAIAVSVLYAGTVQWVSVASLRVPFRAVAVGWAYDHGFYDREERPGGGAFRWTSAHAVAVVQTPRRDSYLVLTFWVSHPDVADHPVRVKVWRKKTLVADLTVSDGQPITRYLHVRADEVATMVELGVDRTWRPSDRGSPDARALGLAVADWTFTCCPPPGALRID
jgi:hypothetical protein